MTDTVYTSVKQYLDALKNALKGAPAGLIADALADCEEHLRGALAAHPQQNEADVFADMIRSYGTPQEVAAAYRTMDIPAPGPFQRTQTPLSNPAIPNDQPRWTLFNVFTDPRTYGALLYLLLALPTGIFYFTWAIVGCSMTLGLAILIIGIPFFLLFVYSIRLLALMENRIVESLLGVRMPRRMPATPTFHAPWSWSAWMDRLKNALGDIRTWSSLFYMFLRLPLGIFYFTTTVTGLAVSGGLIFGGIWTMLGGDDVHFGIANMDHNPIVGAAATVIGVAAFFFTLHGARALGWLHARIAEHLLVKL